MLSIQPWKRVSKTLSFVITPEVVGGARLYNRQELSSDLVSQDWSVTFFCLVSVRVNKISEHWISPG
jgi:hypothetical protein